MVKSYYKACFDRSDWTLMIMEHKVVIKIIPDFFNIFVAKCNEAYFC